MRRWKFTRSFPPPRVDGLPLIDSEGVLGARGSAKRWRGVESWTPGIRSIRKKPRNYCDPPVNLSRCRANFLIKHARALPLWRRSAEKYCARQRRAYRHEVSLPGPPVFAGRETVWHLPANFSAHEAVTRVRRGEFTGNSNVAIIFNDIPRFRPT